MRPETLSVEACVAMARQQAPALIAATLDEHGASADSSAAAFNRRPDFFLSSGATVAPAWSYDPALTNLGEYHAQVGMDWTLSDGGRRDRARERGRIGAESARERRLLASREAGLQAASLALRWLRVNDVAGTLADARAGLMNMEALVSAGVRSGARSPADSIRLALALEDAALEIESTNADARITQIELLAALGKPLASAVVVRPLEPPQARDPSPADSITLLEGAGQRPEVALARLEESTARLEVLEVSRRNAPTVDLGLDAGLMGSDLTSAVPSSLTAQNPGATFADRLNRDLGASAAVTFRLPVLDRALTPAADSRSAASQATAVRRAEAERGEQLQVMELLARWRSAAQRMRLAESVAIRAESHYLRTKSLYAGGATTLFDVLDALQILKDARVHRAESREDLRMAMFEVEDRK